VVFVALLSYVVLVLLPKRLYRLWRKLRATGVAGAARPAHAE
jgi:hypothetical protein